MTYVIDFSEGTELKIVPESDQAATMQNLYCLLGTTLAEVPCYREYGIDKRYLFMPINLATTMVVVAVTDALKKFFPDKRVENVEFHVDKDYPDILIPRIEVTDNE